MIGLLTALFLQVEIDDPASDAPRDPPRAVIYGYPSSTALMLGGHAVTNSEMGLVFVGGASVRLAEQLGVDIEVAGGALEFIGTFSGWLISLGVGPSMQLTGDEPFRGFFISTRIRAQVFQPPQQFFAFGPGPSDFGTGIARAFMAEVDVGYHFRFGRLYFAPVLGVGVGYAYDFVDGSGTRFLQPFTQPSNPSLRPQGIVWSLNLNLARLGISL